jgi:ABC-type transport system involved in multi-copper enzyme maturation permease subunit
VSITLLRALVLDAFYQVLDNKVFRILAIIIGIIVLFPILVGFRTEEVIIFFGWRTFNYAEFFSSVGWMMGMENNLVGSMGGEELQQLAVQAYQTVIIEGLMGSFGIFICLAATAFFIPQMIEKGAADTVFSKPVSRLTLLLARYFTGIMFVAILSLALILGTHVSLLIGSGTSDPAFLWNVIGLTYKFGLLYSVTTLVAVFTRSTVTSILLTVVFLTVNGCIHGVWQGYEMKANGEFDPSPSTVVVVNGDDEITSIANQKDLEDEELEEDEDERSTIENVLVKTLQTLHYALPKTTDTAAIISKLRDNFGSDDAAAFSDELSEFELTSLPTSFSSIDIEQSESALPQSEDGKVLYAASGSGSTAGVRLLVHRRSLEKTPKSSGGFKTESSKRAADAFEDWLEADESRQLDSLEKRTVAAGTTWKRSAREIHWTAFRADSNWSIRTIQVRKNDWLLSFQLEAPEGLELDEELIEYFGGRDYMFGSGSLNAMQNSFNPEAWFTSRLDWTGEWKYTIWFSIGSSLAFVGACLLLSWFRLSRIDF